MHHGMDIEALERDAREAHLPNLKQGTQMPAPKTDGAAAFGESSRAVARKIAARERQATPTGNRYGAIVPALPQEVKGEAAELVGTLITLTQMRDSTSLIVSA